MRTQKHFLHGVVIVLAILMICGPLSIPSLAAGAPRLSVRTDSSSETELSFSVVSSTDYGNVVIIVSFYQDGRFLNCSLSTADISKGENSFCREIRGSYTEYKIFLLGVRGLVPLDVDDGEITVQFLKDDGSLIEQQHLAAGQRPTPPDAPAKEGYLFTGWDNPLSELYEDSVFKAVYLSETAPNIFRISSEAANNDGEIEVSVSLGGTVNLCGFDLRLEYDAERLEFVSLDDELNLSVVANHVEDGHYIRFNYSANTNRTKGAEVMKVVFRMKDGNYGGMLTLSPLKIIRAADADALIEAEYNIVNNEVFAK